VEKRHRWLLTALPSAAGLTIRDSNDSLII
jgi:hypothetical protein